MSERDEKRDEKRDEDQEDPALKALLKRSLAPADPEPEASTDARKQAEPSPRDKELLRAVQRKLRKRSKGKFYGDGWSTTQSRLNYALIAAVMLITIVAVYLALGPTGISLR